MCVFVWLQVMGHSAKVPNRNDRDWTAKQQKAKALLLLVPHRCCAQPLGIGYVCYGSCGRSNASEQDVIPRARASGCSCMRVCVCVCVWVSVCVCACMYVCVGACSCVCVYLCACLHVCPSSLSTRARALTAGDGGSAAVDSDTAHADRVGLGADALLRRHLLLCRHPKSTHQSPHRRSLLAPQEYSPEYSTVVHAGRASVRVRVRMRAYLRARLHGFIDRVGLCAFRECRQVRRSTAAVRPIPFLPDRSSVAPLPVVRLQDSPHFRRG